MDEGGLALELSSDPVFVLDPTHGMEMVHEDCVGIAVYSAPLLSSQRQQHQRQTRRVCIDLFSVTMIVFCAVMHGPGAGQWRRVTANVGRRWTIETAFDVPPVAGLSVLNIASLRAFHIWEVRTYPRSASLSRVPSSASAGRSA